MNWKLEQLDKEVMQQHMNTDTDPRRSKGFARVLSFRWPVPMMMSITHRGTGMGLSGGIPTAIDVAAICSP